MKRRRRFSDIRRSYMRALQNMPWGEVEREAVRLRQYAIAREFFGGVSVESLVRCRQIGGGQWEQSRIEDSIRRNQGAGR